MPSASVQKIASPCCHRTGIGIDSHGFSDTGILKLGGLSFFDVPALRGHSDGDALIHAVIDALLGAASLGDIGGWFSDRSPRTKNISSLILLKKVAEVLKSRNFQPVHIDVTVLADKPSLKNRKKEISRKLAQILQIPNKAVNIKAKRQEALQIFPPTGGILVTAVATLTSPHGK